MKKFAMVQPQSGSFAKITTVEGKRAVAKPSTKSAAAASSTRVGKSRYAK